MFSSSRAQAKDGIADDGPGSMRMFTGVEPALMLISQGDRNFWQPGQGPGCSIR